MIASHPSPLVSTKSGIRGGMWLAGAGMIVSVVSTGCGTSSDDARVAEVAARLTAPIAHGAGQLGCQDEQERDDNESLETRARAAEKVAWHGKRGEGKPIPVKLLGLNDFHGQLSPRVVAGRPAGGAAVLASYLRAAAAGDEAGTFIAHAGDQVGASPPNSALLQDEPAISFLNFLANDHCSYQRRLHGQCNVVGTLGNHEFDEGKGELLRLIYGGNFATGPFLENPWRGARFPYVSANVVDEVTGRPLLPPYAIREVEGVPIAFIGAVLKETPTIVTPTGVAGLEFLDEADAINQYVPELHRRGVHAIVIQIHQGTSQASYLGPTNADGGAPPGPIADIVSRLDDDVDVVISGHTHQFTNAIIPNAHGVPMLVVQAFSTSTAYDDIDLVLDSKSHDVMSKSASIVTTWGDAGPGLAPSADVAAMVATADAIVAPLVNVVIGQASTDITRSQNAAGESALGDLIADSQRVSVGAAFAVMNPGGIRADLAAGTVTWGALFTVQPFGNTVTKLTITGQQIYDLLNQQWGPPQPVGGRLLQISGFAYTWDSSVPEGGPRVTEVHDSSGAPISPSGTYVVAANNFIAAGGDNFTVLKGATNQEGGPIDLDALVTYVKSLPQPFSAAISGRITRN